MAIDALELGIATLTFARRRTLDLLRDIPNDKLGHQLTPGGNHALWILGHLANSDNFFHTTVGRSSSSLPETWNDLFGMNSKPLGDPAKYPALDELQQRMAECRETLISWARSMTPQQLAAPLPDDLATFAPNCCALLPCIAWHEGIHAGQLTMIRRDLGISPMFT